MDKIELTEQTRQFFTHLWRGGSAAYWWYLSETETYIGKDGEESNCTRTFWFEPDRIPQCLVLKNTEHAYFGVHPTTQKRKKFQRSTIETIAAINCLFAEFDGNVSLSEIEAIEPCPSVIIESSPGKYHTYWLLYEPFVIENKEQREQAQKLQYAWVFFTGSDKSAKDLSRILRIPGTRNIKAKYAPDYPLISFVRCNLDVLYSIDELAPYAAPYMEPEQETIPERTPGTMQYTYMPEGKREQSYITKAIQNKLRIDCVQALHDTPDGAKRDTLLKKAKYCGGYLHYGVTSEEEIETVLFDAIKDRAESQSVAIKAIRAGIDYGKGKKLYIDVPDADQNTAKHTANPQETGEVIEGTGDEPETASVIGEGINAAAKDWSEQMKPTWRYDIGGQVWRYWSGTHWKADTDDTILNDATNFLEAGMYLARLNKKGVVPLSHIVKGTRQVKDMLALAKNLSGFRFDSIEAVNFQNGTLHLATMELKPHDSDDNITSCIDYEYQPDTTWPIIGQYLHDTMPDKIAQSVYMGHIGLALMRDKGLHYAVLLYGAKRSGKSTALRLANMTCGYADREYTSNTIFSRDTEGLWARQKWNDRSVNVLDELPVEALQNEDTIKTMIEHGGVPMRRMYKQEVTGYWTGKLIMSANDAPRYTDDTGALTERLIVIRYRNTRPENERDHTLTARMKCELPGFAAACIKVALMIRNQGYYPQSHDMIIWRNDIERNGSNTKEFLADEITIDNTDDGFISNRDLYSLYEQWCHDNGVRNRKQRNTLKRSIKEIIPSCDINARSRIRKHGQEIQERGIKGIRKRTIEDGQEVSQ